MNCKDGRLSVGSQKVTYGYHVIAREKYGLEEVTLVSSTKADANGVRGRSLSHLCGTELCLTPSHIIIEWKDVQDERTHCHFCLKNYKTSEGVRMPHDIKIKICLHTPRCGEEIEANHVYCQPTDN